MKTVFSAIVLLACFTAIGQEIKIPMTAKYWDHDTAIVQFTTHLGVPAVKSKNGTNILIKLKDQPFKDGTIEYDVYLSGRGFPGINFRMSPDYKNGEIFYIRSFGKVNSIFRTTLQYAAMIDGINMWDMSDLYQAGAAINQEGWNHVKLVISGKQMLAYVNDMKQPALLVPELEGRTTSGGISLGGNVVYANFKLIPNATEGLSPAAGLDPIVNDSRYLRNWQVTQAIDFPLGKDILMPLPSAFGGIRKSEVPDSSTKWQPLMAENRALVNLTRVLKSGPQDQRRLAWLKTTINSDKVQERVLSLGFSDECWVFINGQLLYSGKNYYGTPSQKEPDGRCTIENTSIRVPLQAGNNELMIAVGNFFFGWGIIARFDTNNGLMF